MHRFADSIAQTSLSLAIQTHEWVIPTVQSIHIVAIGVVLGRLIAYDHVWGSWSAALKG